MYKNMMQTKYIEYRDTIITYFILTVFIFYNLFTSTLLILNYRMLHKLADVHPQ